MSTPLLDIQHLHTHFFTEAGIVKAVNDVSLQIQPGEVVGLVGESGSGKSILGFSILGLIDQPGRIVSGDIRFRGQSLLGLEDEALRQLRGRQIAMVFQDPMMTLNPVLSIETQMVEALQAHDKISHKAARARALQVLEQVGIPAANERLSAYPHQFSGGMRQRVAIAIAFLHNPALIICDEPTTALDVTIQGQIIYQFQQLCAEQGTALLWISHDLAAVSSLADRILTMYAGRLIESGPAQQVLQQPHHPYTSGLLRSLPSQNSRGQALYQIPGSTPNLLALEEGCPFRSRCPQADSQCQQMPDISQATPHHQYRCWHPEASA
ncbi:ABC transporter ATP-binding protein [Balneatrix alpica]|uniref:ABC transporter ATP-binding protein n=1 Tax=Balneatrix alpica TaxID=75684 RepID=UPI002738BE6F|nr:ABC transporter ATP-binding protein [Balneatrix alpica]